MKVSRLGVTVGLTLIATGALALPPFIKDFEANYKIKPESNIHKASCSLCHVSKVSPKLNPYGLDLKKVMGGTKKITADVLKKVEGLDSDGDGVKNGDEIKADKLPGDPKSK